MYTKVVLFILFINIYIFWCEQFAGNVKALIGGTIGGINLRAIKNNFYMVKLLWKACPSRVILNIVQFLIWRLGELIYSIAILRFIVKSIENGTDFKTVLLFLVGILVFAVITNAFSCWFEEKYVPETNVMMQEYLLTMVYNQAVSCDLSCYENPEFYDKYTRANNEILDRGIMILDSVSNMLTILVSVILCVFIIARWEIIVIPIVIACSGISTLIDKKRTDLKYTSMVKTTPYNRQREYVKRTVYLQDYAKEMRLGNIFFPLLEHFDTAVKRSLEITHHYYGMEAWLRFVREIFMSFGTFLAVQGMIIYRYMIYHAYNLSDVVTIINAASTLQNRFYSFSWNMSDFLENGLYVENIKEFLEYKPKIVENENGKVPKKSDNHLVLKNVSFIYEGQKKPVLKNISIDIPPKTKIALVGHNGAGKSTLVKLLMRLYDVTDGEILLDGTNIKEYRLSEYRKRFGTIFQDFKIFATSIIENILLRPPENSNDMEIAKNALIASGLYDKISMLENGMNTQLTKEFDDNGLLMSGGEFQKIAVARVFARESSIAILDEPSSALDPVSEYEMFNNMMKVCKDKTVIFISHRLSSAIMADKIYLLENGEIIEQGSHEELMKKGGKYAEMFLKQSEKYTNGNGGEEG